MNIPPISSHSSFPNPSQSPEVKQLYDLWTTWYDAASQGGPGAKTPTDNLLNFLKDHQSFFENMTKNTKEPFGPAFKESFAHLYAHTIDRLEAWKQHGYDKGLASPLSEWVGDIYDWCKAADTPSRF